MNDELDRECLEYAVCCGLQALALPADAQFAYHTRTCPACELACDFLDPHEVFARRFGAQLTEAQFQALARVEALLSMLTAEDAECWSRTVLDRDTWRALRTAAAQALREMGWPIDAPPPFVETSPGVLTRPGPMDAYGHALTTTIVSG